MKNIIVILLLLISFLLGIFASKLYKFVFPGFEPVLPTVFYLGRDSKIPDVIKILDVAGQDAFCNDIENWETYVNLIIVDESDYWAVCFCVIGNGYTKNEAHFVGGASPVYVRKSDYSVIKDRPNDAIYFVPDTPYLLKGGRKPWEPK